MFQTVKVVLISVISVIFEDIVHHLDVGILVLGDKYMDYYPKQFEIDIMAKTFISAISTVVLCG